MIRRLIGGRRDILFMLITITAMTALAQNQCEIAITGDVKDGFMKTPLTDAHV